MRREFRLVSGFALPLALCASIASAQPEKHLDAPTNWLAPPYWSPAGGKPQKEPADVGTFDGEVADVVPSPPMPFVATNPCRIADTRGLGFSGQAGPPTLSVGATRVFQITGTVAGVPAQCGIPTAAQAVSFQFSVTGMNSAGNLIAWPDGPPPTTSVLNWNASSVAIGNGIVVPLGATGGVSVQLNGNAGAITHLIIDVNGYYAPVGIVNSVNGLSGAVTLAAGTNISITPAGQNLTIANTAPAAWRLTGNSGTTAGTNFLGTTDNQPFEIKVNNQRTMRFESQVTPNVIGGAGTNTVTAGVYGATIGGGGFFANSVTDSSSTVAGGSGNRAGNDSGDTGDALAATVGGGRFNIAGGTFATVPGGESNAASGAYSFAAGRRAKATHDGSFVWGDSTDADVPSSGANSFTVRATGGFDFLLAAGVLCSLQDATGWICGSPSDRALKRDVTPVDARETLERLVAMPIQTWSYIAHQPGARHMGPMAQDFASAFGLGSDDKRINPLDSNGVALAAIQGLYEIVQEKERRIEALEARLARLESK